MKISPVYAHQNTIFKGLGASVAKKAANLSKKTGNALTDVTSKIKKKSTFKNLSLKFNKKIDNVVKDFVEDISTFFNG